MKCGSFGLIYVRQSTEASPKVLQMEVKQQNPSTKEQLQLDWKHVCPEGCFTEGVNIKYSKGIVAGGFVMDPEKTLTLQVSLQKKK